MSVSRDSKQNILQTSFDKVRWSSCSGLVPERFCTPLLSRGADATSQEQGSPLCRHKVKPLIWNWGWTGHTQEGWRAASLSLPDPALLAVTQTRTTQPGTAACRLFWPLSRLEISPCFSSLLRGCCMPYLGRVTSIPGLSPTLLTQPTTFSSQCQPSLVCSVHTLVRQSNQIHKALSNA